VIATIGEALDTGWKLRVYCREGKGRAMKKHRACTAYHDADLETLVWTRGRDFPIAMLAGRLKCPRCGSRYVSIAFAVPKEPEAAAAPGPHWTKRMTG
jgi:hypothetical protein